MNYISLVLGIGILLSAVIDLIWTTLWVDGGSGPLTKGISDNLWRLLRKINYRSKRNILKLSGPIILLLTLIIWILLLWLSWALIFISFENGLMSTIDSKPVKIIDYFYYAGYVIFTLGNGELSPQTNMMKILTAVATASGMLFLTLGISYIISIVSSVVKKRAFASSISGIALTAEDFIIVAWGGDSFCDLDLLFNSFSSQLSEITYEQKAYSFLNYFHAGDKLQSVSYTLSILDDALIIIESGFQKTHNVNPIFQKKLRSAIDAYVESLKQFSDIKEINCCTPNKIDLNKLQEHGIPVIECHEFDDYLIKHEDRRNILISLSKSNWDTDSKHDKSKNENKN